MYLHEYQSKAYFARFGIPTLPGEIASTQQAASAIAAEFNVPVVVNAQVLVNQRVFRLAHTPQEAEHIARDILAMTIAGVRVRTLLIEPATNVVAEYFLGLYADRSSSLLMSGCDLAQIERSKPQTLLREAINPFLGVLEFQARNLANGLNFPREHWPAFTQIAQNLYRCCIACDAVRAEINPLGLTQSGELVALGGKLVIDDNALFRQPELSALRDEKTENIVQARDARISYIRLSGTIASLVNGAGLGMATMDLLAQKAGSFLDLGGSLQRDKLSTAIRLVQRDASAILFNFFADKTSCEEIVRELLAAFVETQPQMPLVVRLAGHDAEQGIAALEAAQLSNLWTARTTQDAVTRVTAVAKGDLHVNPGQ